MTPANRFVCRHARSIALWRIFSWRNHPDSTGPRYFPIAAMRKELHDTVLSPEYRRELQRRVMARVDVLERRLDPEFASRNDPPAGELGPVAAYEALPPLAHNLLLQGFYLNQTSLSGIDVNSPTHTPQPTRPALEAMLRAGVITKAWNEDWLTARYRITPLGREVLTVVMQEVMAHD